ncbi:MAG: hypothetical protein WDM90_18345 [Ferruginibacter sp.]
MKKSIFLVAALFISFAALASNVDTVTIFSNGMHTPIKAVVITPADYKNKKNAISCSVFIAWV